MPRYKGIEIMDEKKKRQKTLKVSLRESGPPYDLDKYQRVTVPRGSDDDNESQSPDESEEEKDKDSTLSD